MSAPNNLPRKRLPPENKPSRLLNKDENESVFNLLGNKCQTLSTAVVQVYLTEPPSHTMWIKKVCGVVCFVKDNIRKSYFIRVYNMDELTLSWEQELYTQCKYKTPKPFFHMFEAENSQAGLNFADEQEASMFQNVIQDRLSRRKNERRKTQVQPLSMNAATPTGVLPDLPSLPVANQTKSYSDSTSTFKKKKKEKKKEKKITKADIGEPTNFQHVTHVGWDPAKGLDVFQNDDDPYLQQLFNMVGISEKQLQDEDTRKFIYDFIDSTGMGDVLREMSSAEKSGATPTPPPVPSRQPPTPLLNRNPPPAPPARIIVPPPPPTAPPAVNKPKTSPVISRQMGPPPPPPPSRALPQIPSVPSPRTTPRAPANVAPPPPSQLQKSSQPPPPPPMASGGMAPPPPPPPPIPPIMPLDRQDGSPEPEPVPDNRSALLRDIRSGHTLKPVQREASTRSTTDSRSELLDQIRQGIELKSVKRNESDLNPEMDFRDELLNQIREGVQLRSVSETEQAKELSPRDQLLADIRKGVSLRRVETRVGDNPRQQQNVLDGMASALAKALADRSRVIHSSDDSDADDEEDDDDDEWDD